MKAIVGGNTKLNMFLQQAIDLILSSNHKKVKRPNVEHDRQT